jgi:hypothetical protein
MPDTLFFLSSIADVSLVVVVGVVVDITILK